MQKLPYSFDLYFNIKTMDDVKRIAKGIPHSSSAKPEDLISLFLELNMEIPKCLQHIELMYIHTDGTWSGEKRDGSKRVILARYN